MREPVGDWRRWRLRRRLGLRHARRSPALLAIVAATAMLAIVPGAGAVAQDDSPPEITPVTFGTLGSNGWYVSTVTASWVVSDPESIILETRGCGVTTITADTAGQTLSCWARSDGGETSKTRTIKVDVTRPAVSSSATRVADSNGWFNRPVAIAFSATDATSGVASGSCSSVSYGGPDNGGAVVTGTCRDNAGNIGSGSFALRYDATPPTLTGLHTRATKQGADVSWQASPDTKRVEVTRAPGVSGAGSSVVYGGSANGFHDKGLTVGRKYTYMAVASDEAGNKAASTTKHIGTGALLQPAPAQHVNGPPLLAWSPVRRATYYHVQVLRGRRVLAAWPATTRLQLRRTWVMNGRRFRLRPGTYRWYVWPGYGRLSASHYGNRLGGSTFVVTR